MKIIGNRRMMLGYLEYLMCKAVVEDRIHYDPVVLQQVQVQYITCRMTLNTSFDCLDRTYRRVKYPGRNAKKRVGKNLENAAKKFEEQI